MMRNIRGLMPFLIIGTVLACWVAFPGDVFSQGYPVRPITIYCGFSPGATTDVTARALASGAEKMLGVPVVIENRDGGGSTVCAAVVASKNPDGYNLGVISSSALTIRPYFAKMAFDPLKDFTLLMAYSEYIGGLCVLAESPLKTIDDFIAYAKAHPGLSYGSPGSYGGHHLSIELFADCKGLKFKHVPFKGGAPANTALMGKHLDFVAGSGQHVPYVKQGVFRMLFLTGSEKRDPDFPNVPTMKEIGCPEPPTVDYLVVGPKGMPGGVSKKLGETFKAVSETPEFQKVLANFNLPYIYKDGAQIEKRLPEAIAWFKNTFKKMGARENP
jgi:tripartite-type tricarboxylate transporter receptor subunit TctC